MATTTELITKFRNMVDDQLDSTYELELINDAINEIEELKDWEILKKEQAYTIAGNSSYQDTQALPTRFMRDIMLWENSDTLWRKIPFSDRYNKVNSTNGYFLDMANNKIGFIGEGLASNTVYLYYLEYSADLTSGGTWAFPSRFHSVIPYRMAKIYYSADAGEKGRSWDDRWAIYEEQKLNTMFLWDDRLKLVSRSSRPVRDRENSLNLPQAH